MKRALTNLGKQSVARWVPWAALVPVPLWFLGALLFSASAAWRALYFAAPGQGPVAALRERELSHLWYGKFFAEVPVNVPPDSFVAKFETCLSVAADMSVPVMLVADGEARLLVDGQPQLVAVSAGKQRGVEGKKLQFAQGVHHLLVEFSARKRPSVSLLASFDGKAPQAVGSGRLGPGVRTLPPRDGQSPCGEAP